MDYLTQFNAFVHANPYLLATATFGLAHWKWGVKLLFKIKPLRAIVVGNPQEAHQWIAELKTEVDADIDEAVQEAAAHAPAKEDAPKTAA